MSKVVMDVSASKTPVRWGIHAAGGGTLADIIENIHKQNMSCFQIFFGSKMSYDRKSLSDEDEAASIQKLKAYNISMNTHFPYPLNMCKIECRIDSLQTELDRVSRVGGRVIVHTGSCTDGTYANKEIQPLLALDRDLLDHGQKHTVKIATWTQEWREGADNLIDHVNSLKLADNVECPLLLEPPAGEGKKLGWRLEQIKYIYDRLNPNIGFCLDTCHAFAAGLCQFDTTAVVNQFFKDLGEALGGIHKLKLIHLNDSKDVFGALKDRHEVLTNGHIWNSDEKVFGLAAIWMQSAKHHIDIVSECGTQEDINVMRNIYNGMVALESN